MYFISFKETEHSILLPKKLNENIDVFPYHDFKKVSGQEILKNERQDVNYPQSFQNYPIQYMPFPNLYPPWHPYVNSYCFQMNHPPFYKTHETVPYNLFINNPEKDIFNVSNIHKSLNIIGIM